MENEKRLIDANAFIAKYCKDCGNGCDLVLDDTCCTVDDLMNAPTVDAVEVVRCKNCTRGDPEDCPDGRVWCTRMCRYMELDGFCSFGDRRSNG